MLTAHGEAARDPRRVAINGGVPSRMSTSGRVPRIKTAVAILVVLALFSACGGGDDDTSEPAAGDDTATEAEQTPEEQAAGTLDFAGTEYAFAVSETVPSGMTSVTLTNNGDEPHMLDLVPLTDDAPAVEELIRLPEKKVEKFFAGPPNHINPVKPGETSKALKVELEPGRYGYVCFFSKKGEKPHAYQGMFGELTVE